MAELSKIRKDDVDYDIKDAQAREDIEALQQSSGGKYVELLPEASCPVSEEMGIVVVERLIRFVAGKTYLVKWNGADYVRVAYDYDEECVMLGENSDPFNIECYPASTEIFALDGSASVTLSVYEYDEYATKKWVEGKLADLPTVEMVATFDDGSTGTFKLYGEAVTE